jgi:hypothetical protein
MNTTNWTAASTSVHQWQSTGRIGVLKPELPGLAEAIQKFLKEAETRNLAATTCCRSLKTDQECSTKIDQG